MILDASELDRIIRRHEESARKEWARLAKLDQVVGGKHDKPRFDNSEEERKYSALWESSTVNLVGQAVNVYKQRLAVDGYRANRLDDQAATTPWAIWQRSGMDARQKRLYALSITHGYAYLYAGRTDETPGAIIQPVSGRTVYCHYEDPDDEWPALALQTKRGPDGETVWRIWDDEQVWTVPTDNLGKAMTTFITSAPHMTGKVPFSKVEFDWGTCRSSGLVEPLIPLNNMINRITFVLNLIGEHSSFVLRFMTGVTPAVDPITKKPVEPQIGPNKLMVIQEAAGKMGQLDPSDPSGLLEYWNKLTEKFFSLAQMPPHYMIGQMANLSADALLAAEATFAYALNDVTRSFGLGIDRALRLASAIAGDDAAASDVSAQVLWHAVQAVSLAAVVDGLGKMVTMLGVPEEGAWARIPDITNTEIQQWKALKAGQAESDPMNVLKKLMHGDADVPSPTGGDFTEHGTAVNNGVTRPGVE